MKVKSEKIVTFGLAVFWIISLIGVIPATARADTLNLRIIDQLGSPVAGVTINYSYPAIPPANPGSGTRRTNLNGEASMSSSVQAGDTAARLRR